jgi:predicted nucleotidyltransferase component of viral defense system
MTKAGIKDMAASVKTRLLSLAHRTGKPYDEVLVQYALERFLFRLSKSSSKQHLLLKGGLLLLAKGLPQARPTRDIDFLARMPGDPDAVSQIFRTIGENVFPDGVVYDFSGITHEAIAPESYYPGVRLKFSARLGKARIPMQIDVGFGDRVVPDPVEMVFPTLLDAEPPVIFGYAPETIIAEKFEAGLDLADLNSRMKDFYDIWYLSQTCAFDGRVLQGAIIATCERRRTGIRSEAEMFSDGLASRPEKKRQWSAFLGKGLLTGAPEDFSLLLNAIQGFLRPIVEAYERNQKFDLKWPPGGPWKE